MVETNRCKKLGRPPYSNTKRGCGRRWFGHEISRGLALLCACSGARATNKVAMEPAVHSLDIFFNLFSE
jgi:hypothetical protein